MGLTLGSGDQISKIMDPDHTFKLSIGKGVRRHCAPHRNTTPRFRFVQTPLLTACDWVPSYLPCSLRRGTWQSGWMEMKALGGRGGEEKDSFGGSRRKEEKNNIPTTRIVSIMHGPLTGGRRLPFPAGPGVRHGDDIHLRALDRGF